MGKLFVVVGTRPEAIKLVPVIRALRTAGAAVTVCTTGQHRTLAAEALAWFGLAPDLSLGPHPADLDGLSASLLTAIGAALDSERPARVIVQGDTASALAGALAAHHRRLPVAHVEAGLRSGDRAAPWPEEGNRKLIAALADLHFAPTKTAVAALLAENIPAGAIHLTGNSGIDALGLIAPGPPPIDPGGRKLILVTCHRRESFGGGLAGIAAALRALAQRPDVTIALPLHPNPVVRAALGGLDGIRLLDPLPYPDFVRLLAAAHLVLTDSGGVQEEAPTLGVPVLVLRDTTERPEGVAVGTARLVGTSARRIVTETCRLLDDPAAHAAMAHAYSPYGDGRAAERIAGQLILQPPTGRQDEPTAFNSGLPRPRNRRSLSVPSNPAMDGRA